MSAGLQKLPFNLLYGWWACEREVDPGGECRELVLAARTGRETSCCPPVPTSVVATSLLLSSLWVLFWAGHSKCTQWNTWREQKMKIKKTFKCWQKHGQSKMKTIWKYAGQINAKVLSQIKMFHHEVKKIYPWAI